MALPAYLFVGFLVFLLAYSGLNFLLVPNVDDIRNIRGKIYIVLPYTCRSNVD